MTRDEAITLIKGRLKRSADTMLDASIVLEMQFVQSQLLEGSAILPWFLLSENLFISTVANEERVTVPAPAGRPFLREFEEGALWLQDAGGTWHELKKDDYDALSNALTGTGQPTAYALDGPYFRLKKTPDAIYPLRVKAYLRDLALTSNIENEWLKHAVDLFVAEVSLIVASKYLRDVESVPGIVADITTARSRLLVFDEARKHANRSYQMGDD